MKKLSIAGLILFASSMAACSDDADPVKESNVELSCVNYVCTCKGTGTVCDLGYEYTCKDDEVVSKVKNGCKEIGEL